MRRVRITCGLYEPKRLSDSARLAAITSLERDLLLLISVFGWRVCVGPSMHRLGSYIHTECYEPNMQISVVGQAEDVMHVFNCIDTTRPKKGQFRDWCITATCDLWVIIPENN